MGQGERVLVTSIISFFYNVFYTTKDKCHVTAFDLLSGNAFNPLPNDKILAYSKLKAFADNKFSVGKMMISVFDSIEDGKRCGKRRKCWLPAFSLFLPVFF